MSNWKGMMIDVETLGVSRDAVVLSAGIAVFTKDLVEEHTYLEFDVLEQLKEGRTVDRSTQEWWLRTDPEEYKRLLSSGERQLTALSSIIRDMWEYYECESIWARGSMDLPIVGSIMEVPWAFYQVRDVRTLDEIKPMKTNGHNALKDALNQVAFVQEILGGYNGNK